MDELAGFVDRATAAGAPLTARIRMESADRNVLLGMAVPGTRLSVSWPYHKPNQTTAHDEDYDEIEQSVALEDAEYLREGIRNRQEARNRRERAKGGIVDPKGLTLVGDVAERMREELDVRTHADPPPADESTDLGTAEPWPFKPGDVVDDVEGAVAEWLDAAPDRTVVVDAACVEWTNGRNRPADEAPAWVLESSLGLLEVPAHIPSAELANLGPLTIVRVGEAQSPPAEPWPFKPGDVVTDAEDAIAEQLDAAPEGTVVADAAGVEWTNGWNRPADEAPAWVLESSRTSPELPDRVLSADLADLGPLTVVKVREAQSPPAAPWPFKPGDVIEGTDDAATVKLDDAPVGTVVADAAADEWKHEGLSSWVGTYRTNSAGLAARGSLTVVKVGDR
jgi:hypothetical protein